MGALPFLGGYKMLIKTDSLGVSQWAKTYKKLDQFYTAIEIQDNESSI